MKYIWYLVALIAVFAAVILFFTIKRDLPEREYAITINQKHITQEEFTARFASVTSSVHNSDKKDFINTLIMKELLIQEAQKEGIDKDEKFRRSIQDYYEESLIKQVMDKKNKSIHVDVSDDEIDHFVTFQNSTIQVTMYAAENENAAKNGQIKLQDTKTVRAADLSGDVEERLEALKVGEMTAPVCSGSGCDLFRLDSVTAPVLEKLSPETRKKMHDMLLERKKQRAIDSWLADTKKKSTIKISIK